MKSWVKTVLPSIIYQQRFNKGKFDVKGIEFFRGIPQCHHKNKSQAFLTLANEKTFSQFTH